MGLVQRDAQGKQPAFGGLLIWRQALLMSVSRIPVSPTLRMVAVVLKSFPAWILRPGVAWCSQPQPQRLLVGWIFCIYLVGTKARLLSTNSRDDFLLKRNSPSDKGKPKAEGYVTVCLFVQTPDRAPRSCCLAFCFSDLSTKKDTCNPASTKKKKTRSSLVTKVLGDLK